MNPCGKVSSILSNLITLRELNYMYKNQARAGLVDIMLIGLQLNAVTLIWVDGLVDIMVIS